MRIGGYLALNGQLMESFIPLQSPSLVCVRVMGALDVIVPGHVLVHTIMLGSIGIDG